MKRRIDEIKTGERLRQSLGDLSQLKASIQEVGLLQPLLINEKDELISGFRRLEACRQMGWTEVDIIALNTNGSAVRMLDMELHENVGREDLPQDILDSYEKRREALLNPPVFQQQWLEWLKKAWRFILNLIKKGFQRGEKI